MRKGLCSCFLCLGQVQRKTGRLNAEIAMKLLETAALVCETTMIAWSSPSAKLNVLFLVADDLNCDLRCYGQSHVETPNLDELARRGVRFERAYCQFPLCSPSRSSFLTGRRPDSTGSSRTPRTVSRIRRIFGRRSRYRHLAPAVQERRLVRRPDREALSLWRTHAVGTASLDDYLSWDLTINPRGCDRDDLDQVFPPLSGKYRGTGELASPPQGRYRPHRRDRADEAIRLLERFKGRRSRFSWRSGSIDHTRLSSRQRGTSTDIRRSRFPCPSSRSRIGREDRHPPMRAREEQDKITDTQRRQAIKAYWACISFVDAQVGRVLAALDRLGLADRTVSSSRATTAII